MWLKWEPPLLPPKRVIKNMTDTPINKVLVIGATGLLGQPVAEALRQVGYQVKLLVRSVSRAEQKLGSGYEYVAGDVEDEASLKTAMQDCQAVHVSLMGGPSPQDFDRIEHQGTATVARVAAELGLQRLTYLSGAPVHESNLADPGTRAKYHAENAIKASGVPYTIFRATWMIDALALFVQGKRATMPGKQPHPLRWIAASDFAQLVVKALANEASANQTLYAFGPEAIAKPEALKRYLKAHRPDVKYSQMPLWLLSLIAALSFSKTFKADIRRMRFYENIGDDYGSNAKTLELLGASTTTIEQWCAQQESE